MFTGRLSGGAQLLRPIDPLILAQSRTTVALLILAPILLLQESRITAGFAARTWCNFSCWEFSDSPRPTTSTISRSEDDGCDRDRAAICRAGLGAALHAGAPFAAAHILRISGVILAVVGCARRGRRSLDAAAASRGSACPACAFNSVGLMAAEVAAVSFAFYNIYAQHLVQVYQRWTVLVYSLFGAAVFWIVVNPPWKIAAQHYTAHSGCSWCCSPSLRC